MINNQLINPSSIVVVGASNDLHKPGGKILYNIKEGKFKGNLYVTNLNEEEVQGIKSFKDIQLSLTKNHEIYPIYSLL